MTARTKKTEPSVDEIASTDDDAVHAAGVLPEPDPDGVDETTSTDDEDEDLDEPIELEPAPTSLTIDLGIPLSRIRRVLVLPGETEHLVQVSHVDDYGTLVGTTRKFPA